ncbi:MAG TPA: glycosyl transferase family 1 [Proteobacteria bacterium]|nr:glycosyl transferase family 1 [Pseudomonadota bacterium]
MKSGVEYRQRKSRIFRYKRQVINSNHKIRRILFVAEDVTLAHVTRPLVLANSLDRSRYEIYFATGKDSRYLVESFGNHFYTIPTLSSTKFLDRLAKGKPVYTLDELKISVQADLDLLMKLSPDLVAGDFRLSLGISSELLGIPYAALSNAHWSPYATAPFPLPEHPLVNIFGVGISHFFFKMLRPAFFKYHAAAFNALRRTYGLRPVRDLREVYTYGNWSLYLDLPCLAPTSNLPDNHLYLGPVLWSPNVSFPDWWNKVAPDKPIIYVTLGSSGNITVMDTILEVLGEMPVTAMVASAGRFDTGQLSKNIFLEKFLPGVEASKRASLVICSGGSATTYQALACGTPIIGLPSNADQYLTMEAIVREEAGLLIRSGKVTKVKIKRAIEDIFENEDYQKAASRLGEEMLQYDAPARFSAFVDTINENA